MIDEYDSTFRNSGFNQEYKEIYKNKMNDFLKTFKPHKCIIAGVYHPQTLGFDLSVANSYDHFSTYINPNKIAFTR